MCIVLYDGLWAVGTPLGEMTMLPTPPALAPLTDD